MAGRNWDYSSKIIEPAGFSGTGIAAVVENAIGEVSRTLRGLRWFKAVEIRGANRGREGRPSTGDLQCGRCARET